MSDGDNLTTALSQEMQPVKSSSKKQQDNLSEKKEEKEIDLSDETLVIRLKDLSTDIYKKKRQVYCQSTLTLLSVDLQTQVFEAEAKFRFFWKQPELDQILGKDENKNRAFKIYDDQYSIPIDLDDPFKDDLSLEIIEQEYSYNHDTKVVCLLFNVKDAFAERMELRRFPADRQFLNILLDGRIDVWNWITIPPDWIPNELKDAKTQVKAILGPSVSEYVMSEPWADFRTLNDGTDVQPPFKIRFRIQRLPGYYIGNVIIPVFLILFCCYSSLLMDVEAVADRLSVSITLMLAAVAFRFVLAELLPSLSYLTWMDYYVTFSFIIVALFIVENSFGAMAKDAGIASWYDLVFGIVIGIAMLGVNIFMVVALKSDKCRKTWDEMDVEDRKGDENSFAQYCEPNNVLGNSTKSKKD